MNLLFNLITIILAVAVYFGVIALVPKFFRE